MRFPTLRTVIAPSLLLYVAGCGSVKSDTPPTNPDASTPTSDAAPVGAAPVNATTAGTVAEGATMSLAGDLVTADSDTPASGLTYTIRALPTHGTVNLNGAPLAVGGTFTQEDVTNGNVSYVNDGAESATDDFTWDLSDGSHVIPATGTLTFAITVTPVNDSPTIVNNPLSIVAEGGTSVLNDDRLLASDAEGTLLTYTFLSITRGQLQKKNDAGVFVALAANATFTQPDITSGNIRFVDPGTDDALLQQQMNTSASFSWSVADADGAVNPPTGSNISTFTIMSVDDAPTVNWRSQSCGATGTNVNANPLISLSDPDNQITDYSVCLVSIGLGTTVFPSTATFAGSTVTTVPVNVHNGATPMSAGQCLPANALSNVKLDSTAGDNRGSLTWKLVKGNAQIGTNITVNFPVTPTSC